jgi:hypothetical protein
MHGSPASPFLITTSWDDGHPSDLRVADLLSKYGMQATFYVPTFNREGRQVMSATEIRTLAQSFEIGGHTRDHVPLTECTPAQAEVQIRENRDYLSNLLGKRIEGFAYVRGKHDQAAREIVSRVGFAYARTTANLECRMIPDVLRVPTTLQFYPHSLSVRLRNFLRHGPSPDRLSIMINAARGDSLSGACLNAAFAARSQGRFFHLWGHSWELDEFGLWGELEILLGALQHFGARHVNNLTLVETLARRGSEPAISLVSGEGGA